MASGYIRKRKNKDGRIRYQIVLEGEKDPLTGKRNRKYITLDGTKKQIEEHMHSLIVKMESGGIIAPSPLKVESWLTQWLSTYKQDLAETTLVGYEEKIKNYIKPKLGSIALKALNNISVQNMVNEMSKSGLSAKTIHETINILNGAMKKAVVLKMIPHNPCEGIELPRRIKPEIRFFSGDDIHTVLDAAKGTSMYLPVLLELYLGLRRGELIALRWDNVNLENGVVHIRENTVNGKNGSIKKEPKSKAGIRDIAIGQSIIDILLREKAHYEDDKTRLGKAFFDGGYVIRQENGKPFKPDSMTQKWIRFRKENNLSDVCLHGLRHSCATAMIENEVDLKTVQTRLGHSDISVTMNTYAHCTKKMDEKAANKLDDVIFRKASSQ